MKKKKVNKRRSLKQLKHKMNNGLICFCSISLFFGCQNVKKSEIEKVYVNMELIDSVRTHCDSISSYKLPSGKGIKNSYYILDKNQENIILFNQDNSVRGFVSKKDGINRSIQEYFKNGQLKGKFKLNSKGQFDGEAKYFYKDGRVRSIGFWKDGFEEGDWLNYDNKGNLTTEEHYRRGTKIR